MGGSRAGNEGKEKDGFQYAEDRQGEKELLLAYFVVKDGHTQKGTVDTKDRKEKKGAFRNAPSALSGFEFVIAV